MESLLENIHDSLLNGQRKQMVEMIDTYGLYYFWEDYASFLGKTYSESRGAQFAFLADCVNSYHKIKAR